MNWSKTNLILFIIGLILVIFTLAYYSRHSSLGDLPVDENRSQGSGVYEY